MPSKIAVSRWIAYSSTLCHFPLIRFGGISTSVQRRSCTVGISGFSLQAEVGSGTSRSYLPVVSRAGLFQRCKSMYLLSKQWVGGEHRFPPSLLSRFWIPKGTLPELLCEMGVHLSILLPVLVGRWTSAPGLWWRCWFGYIEGRPAVQGRAPLWWRLTSSGGLLS